MFLVRDAFPEDLDQIVEVSEHLNTVNLPADRKLIEELIVESRKSFAAQVEPFRRRYLFVLIDCERGKVVGTSMIQAQHGTRRAPHIYFDVIEEERYSETLDKHFGHCLLRIGYNYSGPTEIGGLILLPEYRRTPHHLGKLLSYMRFVFIGAHRDRFRDEILSELLPPLEADGTSRLWEALGRHFTGMSYQEADRISQHNKEFIRSLFPQEPIYVCILPGAVLDLVGTVGPETRGVEKMLRAVGFKYAKRIDPFDGGPHFIARTDEITLFRSLVRARVTAVDAAADSGAPWGIVAVERESSPRFAACGAPLRLEGGQLALPAAVRQMLAVAPGDEIWVQPVS